MGTKAAKAAKGGSAGRGKLQQQQLRWQEAVLKELALVGKRISAVERVLKVASEELLVEKLQGVHRTLTELDTIAVQGMSDEQVAHWTQAVLTLRGLAGLDTPADQTTV